MTLTPLAKWLTDKGMGQEEFALLVEAVRGARVQQSTISDWVRGYQVPNPSNRVAIERATRGEVKRGDWS